MVDDHTDECGPGDDGSHDRALDEVDTEKGGYSVEEESFTVVV